MISREGCTSVKDETRVQKDFELPVNMPNDDQHYPVCTLTLHYGECKCGHCVAPYVEVSNPVSGQVVLGDVWHKATQDEVASLFEMAQKIDQEELLGWFE